MRTSSRSSICDRGFSRSPLAGLAPARVIDEDPAHGLRGNREELRPVLPARPMLLHQAHPGFVHERRGLQRVALSFVAQPDARHLAQLGVDERHELLSGASVALLPRLQQLRELLAASRSGIIASVRASGRASPIETRAAGPSIALQSRGVVPNVGTPLGAVNPQLQKAAFEIGEHQAGP